VKEEGRRRRRRRMGGGGEGEEVFSCICKRKNRKINL
jgi:hypothetical protein